MLLYLPFDNLRNESDFCNFYLTSHCAFIHLLFVLVCTFVYSAVYVSRINNFSDFVKKRVHKISDFMK